MEKGLGGGSAAPGGDEVGRGVWEWVGVGKGASRILCRGRRGRRHGLSGTVGWSAGGSRGPGHVGSPRVPSV